MDSVASYAIALLFALLMHGLLILLIGWKWSEETTVVANIDPYYIEATIVSQNPFKAKRETENDKRQKKIRQRRFEEAEINNLQRDWDRKQQRQKQQAAMTAPLFEATMPEQLTDYSAADPINEPVDKEASRLEFEQELALALLGEENARKAVTDDEKAMAYAAQIKREIVQNWSRPPSARNGMEVILRVHLVPTGEIVDVKVEESSGNRAFDRSAVQAVRKSSRFVVPADALKFERDFRVFTVLFRPDDLRL